MVQFVYKSLNIGTNSLMFRVIDVFILKSIKGLINLCIIGVNYSCDREALYSHGRRRWETSSVGLNGRGYMTSVSLSLSFSLSIRTQLLLMLFSLSLVGIDVYLCSYLAISVDYAGFVWLLLIDTIIQVTLVCIFMSIILLFEC